VATVKDILIQGLAALGILAECRAIDAFLLYLSELKKWNRAYNLTAITDDREIVAKHFLDSLLYLKAIPPSTRTLCDVGSGAGFPGLPIALVRPDLSIALIEPSRKRCAFLRHLVKRIGAANIEVVESVAEAVEGRQFDVVLTRATFSVAELRKKAGHLVRTGGYLILSKGPKHEDELRDLRPAQRPEIIPAELRQAGLSRYLIRLSAEPAETL
jgi:16S rRNA (guanine527-N7)-methyltransferase